MRKEVSQVTKSNQQTRSNAFVLLVPVPEGGTSEQIARGIPGSFGSLSYLA